MKLLTHRHHTVPHGQSHPVISVSVLLTFLFVGAQSIMFILFGSIAPTAAGSIYQGANPFTLGSAFIGVLLLFFLSADYRRNRIEAHGGQTFQVLVFAAAGVLVAMFLIFISRAIGFSG